MTVDRSGAGRKGSIVSGGQSFIGAVNGDLNTLVFHVAKHGNLDTKDEDGLALIHYAACFGDLPLIRKLYELGADMNLDDGGSPPWRPVHYAIFHRQHEAEKVLTTFGAEVPLPILRKIAEKAGLDASSRATRSTLTITI